MMRLFSEKPILMVSAIILFLATLGGLYYSLNWTSDQKIEGFEIENNRILDTKELEALTNQFLGQDFSSTDLDTIRNLFLTYEYVKDVEVYRSGFNAIAVEVIEAKPIAYIAGYDNDDEVRVLVEGGRLLKQRRLYNSSDLPIFRMEYGKLDSSMLEEVSDLILQLEHIEGLPLITSEIIYTGKKQYKIRTSYADVEVMLGGPEEIEPKAHRLLAFWKNYLVGTQPKGKTLDLRWGDQIIMY